MADLGQLGNSPGADEARRKEAQDAAGRLQDAMFNVRRDACKALAKAGCFAEPYLEQLKVVSEKDDDVEVKKAARNALRELREQGVQVKKAEEEFKLPDPKQQQIDEQNQVWATRAGKQLQDKSWNVRKDGCKRMGTVGRAAEPYLPRLHELLEDDRPEVRKAAETALKKLKDTGVCLPEPEPVEEEPPAPAEEDVGALDAEAYEDGTAELDYASQPEVWHDEAVAPAVQVDVGPEWWESLPGGPTWNPEDAPSYESVLLDEQTRGRIIPKEEKVELDPKAMMRETAQSAAEEIQDVSNVVRRDACKVFGGLGKYAKPYLDLLKGTAEKDPAPDVRLAAKAALKELREDGVAGTGASAAAAAAAAKPEAKVSVMAPSPSWTGPVANFRIFDEVLPMNLASETMTPVEVVKTWEKWGVQGAGRVRFQVQLPEGAEQAEQEAAQTWMNPREDTVPLAPAVVRLEAKVGSVLSALAVALKQKVGQEDAYREERLNRRRDPRSKLWIEGPPMLRRSAPAPKGEQKAKAEEAKEID